MDGLNIQFIILLRLYLEEGLHCLTFNQDSVKENLKWSEINHCYEKWHLL